jgi:hypothetical protein
MDLIALSFLLQFRGSRPSVRFGVLKQIFS